MHYLVLKNTVAGGKPVKAGDVIQLSDDEAAGLILMKRVEETDAPKPKKTKKTTRVVEDLKTPEDE